MSLDLIRGERWLKFILGEFKFFAHINRYKNSSIVEYLDLQITDINICLWIPL